jgi:2-polyprenyl-3-methyl-5-hydroxy-6-metoxy-1,4-benzoquinol methylase
MKTRIRSTKVDIDADAVSAFFADRARRYKERQPLVTVIYQDEHPELAEARDAHEKATLLPLLKPTNRDMVLDIGCGIGRWADVLRGRVARYHGTDFSAELVQIAKERLSDCPPFTFQHLSAQQSTAHELAFSGPFDLVIIAGLFIYLNDHDCLQVFRQICALTTPNARLLLREPIATENRLTLSEVWSDELKHHYSAIYRPLADYRSMIQEVLVPADFHIAASGDLFPSNLANRLETKQHYFILQRAAQ